MMKQWAMTCNNTVMMWRDRILVKAETLDEAWDKAKAKARRKYGGRLRDIHITATEEIRQ